LLRNDKRLIVLFKYVLNKINILTNDLTRLSLVDFVYKTIDFQGDNERTRQEHLLYFYNTFEECESKYIKNL
jgi:homoserine trans-succinylase